MPYTLNMIVNTVRFHIKLEPDNLYIQMYVVTLTPNTCIVMFFSSCMNATKIIQICSGGREILLSFYFVLERMNDYNKPLI